MASIYGFPAEPIDPTRRESHHQNTLINRFGLGW